MSGYQTIIDSIGLQDMYLTNKPEYTQFKSNYERHTNFSRTLLKLEPEGYNVDNFNFNDLIHFDIEKAGDLFLNTILQFNLSGTKFNSNFIPQTAHALIEYIEITSNDKILDKITGDWIYIYNQINEKQKQKNIANMSFVNNNSTRNYKNTDEKFIITLPIPFWFCRKYDMALPLWALQHENIRINLKLRNFNNLGLTNQNSYIIDNIFLINEYVFLTEPEKIIFQQKPIEYIIEQVNCKEENISLKTDNVSTRQIINIPRLQLVNEILWVFKTEFNASDTNISYFNYNKLQTDNTNNLNKNNTENISILVNGNKINSNFPTSFYTKVQRFQNHFNAFSVDKNLDDDEFIKNNTIYSYSFGLNPNDIISSGFLSLDKFNSINLDLQINGAPEEQIRTILIFIKKYNILRIKDGKCELLYNE